MKTRILLTSFAAVAVWPMAVQAQNLFRTGRPSYARTSQHEPGADYYPRPMVADRYGESIGRSPRSGVRRPTDFQSPSDYERMMLAWQNYRREAMRYQQRYGNAAFQSDNLSTGAYGNFSDYRAPCQQLKQTRRDYSYTEPADFAPKLPSTYAPRNVAPDLSTPYGEIRSSLAPTLNYERRYSDPATTARRPLTDLFRSILPQ